MTVEEYLAGFDREYNALADQAAAMDLDTPIPTCPGWTARELVRHTAGVHRWVADTIRERRAKLADVPDLEALFGSWPSDDDLVSFYRAEARACLETIRSAPDDLQTAQFLKIEPSRTFWSRRQFQEATIHRVDLQVAAGVPVEIDIRDAADGVDEMLRGFVSRKWIDLHTETARTIGFDATDARRTWLLRLSEATPVGTEVALSGDEDCLVRGTAKDIYLALWNRPGRDQLAVTGDASLLDTFGRQIQIRW